MRVYDIAHARAGDKGNTSSIVVIAFDDEGYDILDEQLTTVKVEDEFEPLDVGDVERYNLPNINGFNFVLHDALAGGVTTSLRIDAHGKSLSYAILGIELESEIPS